MSFWCTCRAEISSLAPGISEGSGRRHHRATDRRDPRIVVLVAAGGQIELATALRGRVCDTAAVLILVRHGRTPANAAGLLQGRLDQDLDDQGVLQAAAVARLVEDRYGVDAVISSPLKRAAQTAAAFGRTVEIDDRWIELAYGRYEGTPYMNVPGAAWERWRDNAEFAPEGGESLTVVAERVRTACEDLIERASDENVVVVSHVSPIKAAVAWALGVDVGIAFKCHLDQASVCRIEFRSRRPILSTFNETVFVRP